MLITPRPGADRNNIRQVLSGVHTTALNLQKPYARGGVQKRPVPYCMGLRCVDCNPKEPCCEATCGPCPRADCYLAPGSEDDSKYCDEHGEGWLFDLPPHAQRMSDILHGV